MGQSSLFPGKGFIYRINYKPYDESVKGGKCCKACFAFDGSVVKVRHNGCGKADDFGGTVWEQTVITGGTVLENRLDDAFKRQPQKVEATESEFTDGSQFWMSLVCCSK